MVIRITLNAGDCANEIVVHSEVNLIEIGIGIAHKSQTSVQTRIFA